MRTVVDSNSHLTVRFFDTKLEGRPAATDARVIPHVRLASPLVHEFAMVPTTTNTSRAVVAFPELLHYILDELEKSGRSNIAVWKPHGRCFAVYDRKVLIDKVLPL